MAEIRKRGMKAKILAALASGLSDAEAAAKVDTSIACIRVARIRASGYVTPATAKRRQELAHIEKQRIERMRETPWRIPLTQGKYALIDEADFELLAPFRWQAHFERGKWYATANNTMKNGGDRKALKMHRLILGVAPGVLVDHKDGDGLNNRRYNLRAADSRGNSQNAKRSSAGTEYQGIYFYRATGQWTGQVTGADGVRHSIGYHDDDTAAAIARDRLVAELHGEFAKLNFPDAVCYRPTSGEAA